MDPIPPSVFACPREAMRGENCIRVDNALRESPITRQSGQACGKILNS
jgi:hypothetical protein